MGGQKVTSETCNRLLKDLTAINVGVFSGCSSITNVNIPAAVTTLKNLAFANCTALNSVTVNSAAAPDGYTVTEGKMAGTNNISTDPFQNVAPNNLTLHFSGDAATGTNFKNYREGTAESSAFKRLLTKTIDENASAYNVAGQMHADVVLKRTMKAGWNTVALPFGVNNNNEANRDRDYGYAGVYKNAFNGESEDFMIAAYRGIENDVFKFLKYASYTTDPLDEFEPLLIRMGADDLNESNEYNFVDVDLNYDYEQGKLYRENNTEEAVPTQRWDGSQFVDYYGSGYNHDWEWFSGTDDSFAFKGTYSKQTTGENFSNTEFIQPGDYIIQDNLFYEVINTKKYGLKGFRAWFHDRGVGTGAKPETLMFTVYERPEATEIDEPTDPDDPNEPIIVDKISAIDSLSITPQDIYTMSGQLVRKNATTTYGLAKGMYIMGGKKIVVE